MEAFNSSVSTCKATSPCALTPITRRFTRNTSPLVFFFRPRARYSRSPNFNTTSSPRISTGTSIWGAAGTGTAAKEKTSSVGAHGALHGRHWRRDWLRDWLLAPALPPRYFFLSCCFCFCWQWLQLWLDTWLWNHHRRRCSLRWPLAFSQPRGTVQQHAQALRRWRHFQRVGVRVHALRELHAEAFDAHSHQFLGQLRGGFVARFVAVVGDVNPLRAVPLEGRAMVRCEAIHAIARGYIAVARNPERQRVDQRFAQDDFFRCDQGFFIPHAPVLAFQVQVVAASLAQIRRDLPPVHLHHVTGWIDDRDNQRAVEMLVAALPVDAQLLQPPPHCRAVGAVLRRQAIAPASGWRNPAGNARPSPQSAGPATPDTALPPAIRCNVS